MDTTTLPPGQTSPAPAAPAPAAPPRRSRVSSGLGAEVRESLLLLGFAVVTTVGLTTAAQAALALLG